MNKENKNGGIKNINNNKNIIYINLPKKVYRKPQHNKEEIKREFSNQSNLYPTLYRPIYNDISPNINRPIANDNFIKMGNSKEVVDVESNIDEINTDFERYKNTFEETNPIFGLKTVKIRKAKPIEEDNVEIKVEEEPKNSFNKPKRGRPLKYSSKEEKNKAIAKQQRERNQSLKSAKDYANRINDQLIEDAKRQQYLNEFKAQGGELAEPKASDYNPLYKSGNKLGLR